METPEFKDFARSMVDFIGDYLDNIRDRWDTLKRIGSAVQPPLF
jgi:hypothetical protein